MNIFRNVYASAVLTNKSYKYIECKFPAYFDNSRYLIYNSNTNYLGLSFFNLYRPERVPNNTSIQDLINGT